MGGEADSVCGAAKLEEFVKQPASTHINGQRRMTV